jgi:GNAT superfamily N-acetyltransferase
MSDGAVEAIERAGAADIPILLDLMSEFYAESEHSLDRAWAGNSFGQLLGDRARGGAWIARAGGEPAGYVVLVLRHSMEFGGLGGIIDDLFVRPAQRRKGFGAGLMDAAFEECRRLGAVAVEVEVGDDNAVAANLYRGYGLVEVDGGRVHLAVRLLDP